MQPPALFGKAADGLFLEGGTVDALDHVAVVGPVQMVDVVVDDHACGVLPRRFHADIGLLLLQNELPPTAQAPASDAVAMRSRSFCRTRLSPVQISKGARITGTPAWNTASAASGSTMMLNSDTGLQFPGILRAPPMMVTDLKHRKLSGSLKAAICSVRAEDFR